MNALVADPLRGHHDQVGLVHADVGDDQPPAQVELAVHHLISGAGFGQDGDHAGGGQNEDLEERRRLGH